MQSNGNQCQCAKNKRMYFFFINLEVKPKDERFVCFTDYQNQDLELPIQFGFDGKFVLRNLSLQTIHEGFKWLVVQKLQ